MGLNYAFVFALERARLSDLDRALRVLAVGEEEWTLLGSPRFVIEDGDFRFGVEQFDCLVLRVPDSERLGCIWLERREGRRSAVVTLRACGSSMSRRFVEDPAVEAIMRKVAGEANALLLFDTEQGWVSFVASPNAPKVAETHCPYWSTCSFSELKERREEALATRALILGTRLAHESDAVINARIADEEAYDADVDGFVRSVRAVAQSS